MPSSLNLVDLQPKFDYELLENYSLNSIEIRPEAPWIKRSINNSI